MRPKLLATILPMAAAIGMVTAFTASPANAVLVCTSTMTATNGQTFSDTSLAPGVCVQAADKLYGNFVWGNLPQVNGDVRFTWSALIGGTHTEQFENAFVAPGLYAGFGFEVFDSQAPLWKMTQLTGDFDESMNNAANSVLTKVTDASGTLTCNRPNGSCPTTINLLGVDQTDLTIRETLNLGLGAVTNAVINTITETQVPEPATLALLGTALIGFGLMRRRRKGA